MRIRALSSILLLLALLAAGCAGSLNRHGQLNTAECLTRAEDAIAQKNYPEAADYLEAAIFKDPANGGAYLRRAEILETLGKDRQARNTYRAALKALPDSAEKSEAGFRLALLQALKFNETEEAVALIPTLPEGSAEKLDLQGIVALKQEDPREALQFFSRAQENAGSKRIGLILYHASLAYQALGDEEKTFSTLFHAINLADNLAEAKDIERLYNQLTGR